MLPRLHWAGDDVVGSQTLSSLTSLSWVLNSTHLACTVTHTGVSW